MLPTEVQRILLLVGLAATAYLMILAWNEDYNQTGSVPEYGAVPEVAGGPSSGMDIPADTAQPLATDTDVPDAAFLGPPPAPSGGVAPAAEVPAESRLIQVLTPTLEVWIDRRGGDVVRVRLPEYPVSLDEPDTPYLLLDNGGGRTYVAQSGLIGPDGVDAGGDRPLYRTRLSRYELEDPQGNLVVELETEQDGLTVVKSFRFSGNNYLVDVDYRVTNGREAPIQAGLFAQIKRDGGDPPGDSHFTLGPRPYVGPALTTLESRYEKLTFDDLDDEEFRQTISGGWIAMLQHYFLSAWVAEPDQENRFYGRRRGDGIYTVGYAGPVQAVPAGATGNWNTRFYAGPKDQDRLKEISPNLNLTVDYGFLWWLAVPLFQLLQWLHALAGNWGVAIILLTVLVKLVLWPLTAASFRSMANMRRVAPQMKRLQERYADDRQKLSQEMMALYKKEGVNPLGGCLPMLLPMPIFLALYWVLYESVELRQAPFMLWIQDLAVMDPFFVLPLLMGASMYLQQLLSPAMGDPMQVRMMRMMPVIFTVLFLFFPAGLVLYWLVNNVISIAQQYWVIRQTEGQPAKN